MSDKDQLAACLPTFKNKRYKIAEPINREKYWFSLIRATQWRFCAPTISPYRVLKKLLIFFMMLNSFLCWDNRIFMCEVHKIAIRLLVSFQPHRTLLNIHFQYATVTSSLSLAGRQCSNIAPGRTLAISSSVIP